MKTCTKCKQEKSLDQYHSDGRGGKRSVCKTCRKLPSKMHRANRTAAAKGAYGRLTREFILSLEYPPKCPYCGRKAQAWELDHIIPLARGGDNTPDNVHLVCSDCNQMKGALLESEFFNLVGLINGKQSRPTNYAGMARFEQPQIILQEPCKI